MATFNLLKGLLPSIFLAANCLQLAYGQVYLSLGSTNITTNNTEILITDFGGINEAPLPPPLVCHTDLEAIGEWYFPDGSVVHGEEDLEDFYTVQGQRNISLNRYVDEDTEPWEPTGSYCCVILTTGGEMTFCAQIDTVFCQSLTPPTNGYIRYSDPTLGHLTKARYSCDPGYELKISSYYRTRTRTCYSSGWSGGTIQCSYVYPGSVCGPVETPRNAKLNYSVFSVEPYDDVGTTVTYSCDEGYVLIGSSTRTCRRSGRWSPRAPNCRTFCPPLPKFPNGGNKYSTNPVNGSYELHTTANFTCNQGYQLLGNVQYHCGSQKEWYPGAFLGPGTYGPPHCADIAVIQLKFGPTLDCLSWSAISLNGTGYMKASDVRKALRRAIHEGILSGSEVIPLDNTSSEAIPLDHIGAGVFSCRTSQTFTTYRTTIHGTREVSAVKAAADLQKWVESGPVVTMEWYLVDVIPSCPVHIASLMEDECKD